MTTHDTIAQAHMDISRTAIEAGRQRRTPPDEPFAIVIDRLYDGEGPSLAYWNGENYQFTDGDCYDREGDTLGGYTAEFLTDYQLEERLFDDCKRGGEPYAQLIVSDEDDAWPQLVYLKGVNLATGVHDLYLTPQPAEPIDSLPRHAAQTLATAIYETAQKMGIANGDHSTLSVPQCLHLLDCMSQPDEPSKNDPRKGDQRIIDGVVWTCTDPEIDRWVTTGSQPAESIVSDVEAIVRLLERREWADHVATTPLGQRLETAVTVLVGTDQQPAEPEQKPSVEALAEMANGWSFDHKELASKVLERRQPLKHQGYQPIQSGPLPPPPAPQPAEPVGEVLGETCIDGGKCHHGCKERCFRRQCCDPFSDYSGPWEYADETIYPQPTEPVKTLIDNQEPLGEEFQRVLDEHSWDLYVKTNEPVKVPSSFPTGTEYSVEPHGNGYAIYQGRDQFHHGLNLAHLTECTPEFSKRIESALNAMSGVVKSHLKVSYDDKGDCLYVVCDSNEPADAEEDDMGILYRRAISDGRLVGITIMNFMGRLAESSDDAPQPAEPVAWTTPDEREPISASLKESRLDLYGKHYTVPLYTTPQPTEPDMGEPVAWKWRRTPATKWECVGHWDSIEAKAAAEMESQGWEVVRLYDSPQPPEPRK